MPKLLVIQILILNNKSKARSDQNQEGINGLDSTDLYVVKINFNNLTTNDKTIFTSLFT